MDDIQIIWDLEDDPEGNYWHIVVEGHGVTCEEVEEVLLDDDNETDTSHSSGRPSVYGWTSLGQHIIVVYDEVMSDPRILYPVTAYPVPPRKKRRTP